MLFAKSKFSFFQSFGVHDSSAETHLNREEREIELTPVRVQPGDFDGDEQHAHAIDDDLEQRTSLLEDEAAKQEEEEEDQLMTATSPQQGSEVGFDESDRSGPLSSQNNSATKISVRSKGRRNESVIKDLIRFILIGLPRFVDYGNFCCI